MRYLTVRLLLLMLACAGATDALALDEHECRIGLRGSSKVLARCATLTVPADPQRPDGEQLELAVARIPALAATPLPDPLVLIQGGPGGSSIDMYLSMSGALTGLRRNRDVIVMDQRGTGRSMQGLTCETPADVDIQTAAIDVVRRLLEECLAVLERDPRFYTTSLAVRDLDALRAAYGIDQWNLYGASYGTRVAQHYARHYPEHTRTVILDGSVPATLALGPGIARATQDSLDAIFARCRQDSGCSEQFGNVSEKFAEVRNRLQTQEIMVGRVDRATGQTRDVPLRVDALLGLTRMMSYSAATAALLPLTIDEAHAGRYGTLFDQTELVLGGVDRAINMAMHNTVICSEDWPRVDPAAGPVGEGTYLGETLIDVLGLICENWPVGPVDADFNEPLVTDVPILLISGSADPATPAAFAEEIMANGVSNSRHIVVADQGHGVFAIGCMPQIAEAFIEAASVESLDASCIDAALPVPFFLTPAGPAP